MSKNHGQPEPLAYTLDELCARLNIKESLARRLTQEGRIPSLRLGRRIVYPRAAIEQWLITAATDGNVRHAR